MKDLAIARENSFAPLETLDNTSWETARSIITD